MNLRLVPRDRCATRGEVYSQIIQALVARLNTSQISTPARLIFVTHRDDIPAIPARRGRQPVTLVDGAGAAPAGPAYVSRASGGLGSHRPAQLRGSVRNGLVERMNAGESPRNQGRSEWAPLSVSRRRSRGLRKSRSGAPRGAPVRVMGRQSRPLTGEAMPQGRPTGAAFRAREFRRSASLLLGVRRVRNRQFGTTVRRDAPRGNAPARLNKWRRNDDAEVYAPDSPSSCPALCRASTPCFANK